MKPDERESLTAGEKLTKRENQIAGLAGCGLAKKEIADRLGISYNTVTVFLDKAYKKTNTSKLNELGVWWLNKAFSLNIDFVQLQKSLVALSFICIISVNVLSDASGEYKTVRRIRIYERKIETEYEF